MRITINKTIELDEVPIEIDDGYDKLCSELEKIQSDLSLAKNHAGSGRYVDASNAAERIRLALTLLDKNLEEIQSLCLSYEKIRMASLMPPQEVPDDE